MLEDSMTQVPIWIVATLGKEVALTREFVGACETYTRGCRGTLTGVEVSPGTFDGAPYAVVALDPADPGYLENFRFSDIRPAVDTVKFSFNLEMGVIAF